MSEPAPATVDADRLRSARRNARLYLAGLAASLLGDSAMTLVAGIWVKSRTGSSALAAVVSVCVYAPSLLGPVAGLVCDRVRRRPLLLVVNLASAVAVAPLVLVDRFDLTWLIFVVMGLYGFSLVLIDAGESALFAVMLPGDVRARVNGIRLSLQEGGKLAAPALGAGLFALLGGGAVALLDAATFVVAAVMLALLRVHEPRPRAAEGHWRAELLAGFAFLRRDRALAATVSAAAAAMAISAVVFAAQFDLVDALHRPPSFLGVLVGLLGGGSVVAGLTSSRVLRHGEHRLLLLGLADGVLGYGLRATGWLPAVLAGSFVLGFALPWVVAAALNLVQRRAPEHLQGRCAAALSFALFAPLPVLQLAGAALITHVGYRAVFGGGAVLVLAVLWAARRERG